MFKVGDMVIFKGKAAEKLYMEDPYWCPRIDTIGKVLEVADYGCLVLWPEETSEASYAQDEDYCWYVINDALEPLRSIVCSKDNENKNENVVTEEKKLIVDYITIKQLHFLCPCCRFAISKVEEISVLETFYCPKCGEKLTW